jgi:hypothetical protein
MASKMPAEVLERFKQAREKESAPSGEEAKKAVYKRAKEKAQKAKAFSKKDR